MKKIIAYSLAAFLMIGAAACTEEFEQSPEGVQEGISLTLRTSSPLTRTMPGVSELNENKITSLHYFFYPMDPDNPAADPLAQQPLHWGYIPDLNAENEYVLRLNFTDYKLNYEVFPRPFNTCQVYIIANLPETITIDDNTDRSLANLRSIALQADFLSGTTQDYFVMEGLGEAAIIDRKNIIAASGTVPLDRVASKVTVSVETVESYQPEGESGRTWYPEPESMTIEFVNGVSRAVLGGSPVDAVDEDYFRTASRTFTENTDGSWSADQFYSYPAKWNVGDDEEPYVRIMLPWKTIINTGVDGEDPPIEDYQKCYYKLILGGTEMARNTWYDMKVNIGVFGSFDEQEEVLLDVTNTTYYVADWTTGLEVESNIEGGRYLVVEKLTYEIYNQNVLEIPITTSHICEIVDMSTDRNENQGSITYPDYSNETADEDAEYEWDDENWSLKIVNDKIVFEHELNNDLNGTDYDYAPYTIKFTVRHTDATTTFYKDITIIQNPAMVIQAKHNSGTYDNGYAFVNNGRGDYYGGDPDGLSNNNNKNQNMYVITTSSLPNFQPSDFLYGAVIGDPRLNSIDNLDSSTGWDNWYYAAVTSSSVQGNNRSISWYYPTDDTEGSANMIAPKFRIASSHGACSVLSYDDAFKRCASYQEDGYPAGRWRVPTKMELKFMSKLTDDKVIPRLLGNTGSETTSYWCGDGYVTVPNATNTTGTVTHTANTEAGNRYVRCVYDEWYWENSKYARLDADGYDQFTWGDMSRENFE